MYGIHDDPSPLAPADKRPYGQTFKSGGLPVALLDDAPYEGTLNATGRWFVKTMDEEGVAFAVPIVTGVEASAAYYRWSGALDKPFQDHGPPTEQWHRIKDWWTTSEEASWITLPRSSSGPARHYREKAQRRRYSHGPR